MISIFTVSYNAAFTIKQTIRSVVNQTYPDIEYVVTNGASTYGTAKITNSFESELACSVTECDEGIAVAMNEGLDLASVRYVLNLNADDYLVNCDVIERIALALDHEIVAAPIVKLEENRTERLLKLRGFNWWFDLKTGLFDQATLCSKNTLLDLGGFETKFKCELEYNFFSRAYRPKVHFKLIDQPISLMRPGLCSRTCVSGRILPQDGSKDRG